MTPEEKSLLERTYNLAEENNALLRKMRRSAQFSSIMRYVYWAVIIGLSFGAYYLIQPYVDFLVSEFGSGQASTTGSSNGGMVQSLQDLLK